MQTTTVVSGGKEWIVPKDKLKNRPKFNTTADKEAWLNSVAVNGHVAASKDELAETAKRAIASGNFTSEAESMLKSKGFSDSEISSLKTEASSLVQNKFGTYVKPGDSSLNTDAGTSGSGLGSFGTFGKYDSSALEKSAEFKALSKDDQDAVRAVFAVVAGNDKEMAARLANSFATSAKINDPYFRQQLHLATDAIERGYVSIDKESEFAEKQAQNRLNDLRKDFESTKEFLTFEQQTALKGIERSYEENLTGLRDNMAATGFTQSSRRIQKEGLLEEATGELRESTNRQFAFKQEQNDNALMRSERDTAAEIARLKQLTDEKKLDFLRSAEEKVGTGNLPTLSGAPAPLGGIYGDIPREQLSNTLSAATSFVF